MKKDGNNIILQQKYRYFQDGKARFNMNCLFKNYYPQGNSITEHDDEPLIYPKHRVFIIPPKGKQANVPI